MRRTKHKDSHGHLAGDNNLSAECVFVLTEMFGSGRMTTRRDRATDTGLHENTRLVIDFDTKPGNLTAK